MSWEGFMQIERRQLQERREGKLRRALGVPLAGETVELLDRIGEQDRLKAEQGLVSIIDYGDRITYKRLDDLTALDMESRTEAEWITARWLRERMESLKKRTSTPSVPKHLRD